MKAKSLVLLYVYIAITYTPPFILPSPRHPLPVHGSRLRCSTQRWRLVPLSVRRSATATFPALSLATRILPPASALTRPTNTPGSGFCLPTSSRDFSNGGMPVDQRRQIDEDCLCRIFTTTVNMPGSCFCLLTSSKGFSNEKKPVDRSKTDVFVVSTPQR